MKKTNDYKNLDNAIRQLEGHVLNVLPKTQNDSNKELRTLDSLARLFKGTNNLAALFNKDTTVNVFYNPAPLKSIDNQFALQFFNHLTTIKINKDKSLLELQILNIKSLTHDLSKNIFQIQNNVNPLNKVIIKLLDAVNNNIDVIKDYVNDLCLKVIQEHNSNEDNTTIWNKYISCLFSKDIGTILNLYQESYTLALQDESTIAKKVIRNFKDFNKVVKYYEESDLKNVEFPIVENEDGDQNLRLHAELQALEVLSRMKIGSAFIGISKLCCYQCDYTFKIFNDVNKASLIVRGTHGKIYLGWVFPENIQEGESIKKLFLDNCNKILTNFKSYVLDKSILDDPNNSQSDVEVNFNGVLLQSLIKQGNIEGEKLIQGNNYEEQKALKGSAEYGEEKEIDWVNPYFGKYTLDALYHIITSRINNLQLKDIKILQGVFIDQNYNNISDLLFQISSSTEKITLIPLNLFNKHAVGLVFEKNKDNTIQVCYLDSLNNSIPQELKQLIINNLGSKINFKESTVEQQKYGNCGAEVVENFILYLTGKRASQEKAVELHSKLVENALLNIDSAGLHLLFEELHYSFTDYLEQIKSDNNLFHNVDYDNSQQINLLGQEYHETI